MLRSYGGHFATNYNIILLSHKIRIPTESTQRVHCITIRDFNQKRFVQKLQHIRPLLRAHILHINMRSYVSGCVRANAYNLIFIFASFYYAPGPGPGPVLCIVKGK